MQGGNWRPVCARGLRGRVRITGSLLSVRFPKACVDPALFAPNKAILPLPRCATPTLFGDHIRSILQAA
jgi:hypothetical protein